MPTRSRRNVNHLRRRKKMSEYMIHACKKREWYVEDFLIPSMVEQGIARENVEVWMDENGDGCLFSCMKAFHECGKRGKGRWHMQDDAVIAHDFAEKTAKYDDGVVCGFCNKKWQSLPIQSGVVRGAYLWNSFICIRIPDEIAGECAEWFFNDAAYREVYEPWVRSNKADDSFFFDFFNERYALSMIRNLNPNIVDHIDYLIGGSVINKDREYCARSSLWEDEEAVNNLIDKLAHR